MKSLLRISFALLLTLSLAGSSFPFGSKEKSPEEVAAAEKKRATEIYNDGIKHMKKAEEIALKGDSAYAFNYRATADAKVRKELEKAVLAFDRALVLDSTMKEAHNNLGYTLRKLGKLVESISAYQKALAIDSMFAEAHEYLGETYLAMDDLEKATAEQEKLKAMQSPLADVLMKSIDMYKLQQMNKALERSH